MTPEKLLSALLESIGIETLEQQKHESALSILRAQSITDATAKVLWWKYCDGSAVNVVRVYIDDKRANDDYELAKLDETREWYLSVARVIR
jgi:CTP:phosphocholine cytidylyltransferase-like protein